MIDNKVFDNTEIAFQWKSDKELKQAVFLFKSMSKSFVVKLGKVSTNTALAIKFPIAWAVRPTIYRHFVGGETLESCSKIIDKFSEYNVEIILDYSVEGGETEEKIDAALAETLRTVENAAKNPNIPFAVFKPTAFCPPEILETAYNSKNLSDKAEKQIEKFKYCVETLCQRAYDLKVPIMIDAEDYAYQTYIDDIVFDMMLKFNKEKAIVYNTLQMYRVDRLDYLKSCHQKAIENNIYLGMKYVRGAYMEKERERAKKMGYEDPIHANKQLTDEAFDAALTYSVENIDRISIFNATHNEKSNIHLANLMEKHSIDKKDRRCFFSQLFGMSDNITFNLAKLGYRSTKYTPYGPINHVLPYLIRRAEENTAVAGQTSRELQLFKKEKQRRKNIR